MMRLTCASVPLGFSPISFQEHKAAAVRVLRKRQRPAAAAHRSQAGALWPDTCCGARGNPAGRPPPQRPAHAQLRFRSAAEAVMNAGQRATWVCSSCCLHLIDDACCSRVGMVACCDAEHHAHIREAACWHTCRDCGLHGSVPHDLGVLCRKQQGSAVALILLRARYHS
jgi:hypothetical protein